MRGDEKRNVAAPPSPPRTVAIEPYTNARFEPIEDGDELTIANRSGRRVGVRVEPEGEGPSDRPAVRELDIGVIAELVERYDDLFAVARGCLQYGGGYRADPAKLEIYHHGIRTVVNALEAARDTPGDTQVAMLRAGGGEPAPGAIESPSPLPSHPAPGLRLPKGVEAAGGEARFIQYRDDFDEGGDPYQSLTIAVEDAGAGRYLAISTRRWALDISAIDDFAELLRSVAGAFGGEEDGPSGEGNP